RRHPEAVPVPAEQPHEDGDEEEGPRHARRQPLRLGQDVRRDQPHRITPRGIGRPARPPHGPYPRPRPGVKSAPGHAPNPPASPKTRTGEKLPGYSLFFPSGRPLPPLFAGGRLRSPVRLSRGGAGPAAATARGSA